LRVDDLASVWSRLGLDPRRRAETLALDELAALATALFHARAPTSEGGLATAEI
jgi:hypothetical protein